MRHTINNSPSGGSRNYWWGLQLGVCGTEVPQRGMGKSHGGDLGLMPQKTEKIEIRPSVFTVFSIHFSKI
jgi:hypothetical protein